MKTKKSKEEIKKHIIVEIKKIDWQSVIDANKQLKQFSEYGDNDNEIDWDKILFILGRVQFCKELEFIGEL